MCDLIVDANRVEKKTIIRNLILSIESPFTMKDIIDITERYDVFDAVLIKTIMIDLCETGILSHIDGLFYVVNDAFIYV